MFTALKGSALIAATVVVVSVIGSAAALAWNGTLSGSDFLTIATLILGGVVGVTSAHVAGQTAAAAINTPPPVAAVESAPAATGGPNATTTV